MERERYSATVLPRILSLGPPVAELIAVLHFLPSALWYFLAWLPRRRCTLTGVDKRVVKTTIAVSLLALAMRAVLTAAVFLILLAEVAHADSWGAAWPG